MRGGYGRGPARVILQISSVAIPAASLSEYLDHAQRNEISNYEIAPGLESVLLVQRPFVAYVEVMTISIWRSEKALARFSANQPSFDSTNNEYGGVHLEPHIYEVVTCREGNVVLSEID
jgi:heme-degrading monooxygenase HmoA